MKILHLLIFSILAALILANPVQGKVENLYVEKVDGYSRIDGETLRWDEKREFTINDYEFYEIETNVTTNRYVNISMTDSSTHGLVHEVSQIVDKVNFKPTLSFRKNGSLQSIEWSINLFRIPDSFSEPFDGEALEVLADSNLDHRRFDMFTEPTYFTVALEYYEYHEIDGEVQRIRVNTNLITDNYADGRSFRSSMHIVKRAPDGEILFDFTRDIKESTQVYRWFNLVDQPVLWVPLQFAAVLAVVYTYIRITRYWKENDYRIVKGEHEENEKSADVSQDES